jgi:hypothetical protein
MTKTTREQDSGTASLNTETGSAILAGYRASIEHASDTGVSLPTHLIPAWDSLEEAIPQRIANKLQIVIELLSTEHPLERESAEAAVARHYEAIKEEYDSAIEQIANDSGFSKDELTFEAVLESLTMETLLERPELLAKVIDSIELIAEQHRNQNTPGNLMGSVRVGQPAPPPSFSGQTTNPRSGIRPVPNSEESLEDRRRGDLEDHSHSWEILFESSKNGEFRQPYAKIRTVAILRGRRGLLDNEPDEDLFGAGHGRNTPVEREPGGDG